MSRESVVVVFPWSTCAKVPAFLICAGFLAIARISSNCFSTILTADDMSPPHPHIYKLLT